MAATPQSSPTTDAFPMEIIADILSRLPEKEVGRSKCVAKRWNDLLSSTHFIQLHLSRKTKSKLEEFLVLANNSSLQTVDLNTLSSTGKINLPRDFISKDCDIPVIGSCNGLLCLCSDKAELDLPNLLAGAGEIKWDIALVNPLMKTCKVLVSTPLPARRFRVSFGFGYDSIRDDYKVVRIVEYIRRPSRSNGRLSFRREVKVYSLRNNSWRLVLDDLPESRESIISHGVFAENKLFFMSERDGEKNRIVSFDLADERFDGEVPLPPYYRDQEHRPRDVGSLNGHVCLLTEANAIPLMQYIDVWVMKEYGNASSWRKMYSTWCLTYPKPIVSSKSGSEVLVGEGKKLYWYNSREQTRSNVELRGMDDYFQVVSCVGSLVPVQGYGCNDSSTSL